jgi:hypothetical protein
MRKALLAWELGSGSGHVMALRRLARRLKQNGIGSVAAVKNLAVAAPLAADGIEVLQAPMWPTSIASEKAMRSRISSITLGEMLAGAGLADRAIVRALFDAARSLIRLVGPDIVIAEYAPATALAARGVLPLVLVGTGYSLPPSELERFPTLFPGEVRWDEEKVVEAVNAALQGTAGRRIARLPEIFACDFQLVRTLPLLDPYRRQRTRPADGALLDREPVPRRPDASRILVYLNRDSAPREDLRAALEAVAPRLRLVAPGLEGDFGGSLAAKGAIISVGGVAMQEELAQACLLAHFGGAGLSAEALLAGVPQAVLATDIEKFLNGTALQAAGVAHVERHWDAEARISRTLLARLAADAALAERAAAEGERQRLVQPRDPMARFVAACLRLCGLCKA